MKSVKMYLLVVSSLLCIAIGLGIYVWYNVQKYDREIKYPQGIDTQAEVVVPEVNPRE